MAALTADQTAIHLISIALAMLVIILGVDILFE